MIRDQYCLLAVEVEPTISGFASLDKDYIDFIYVHQDYQDKGIATTLLHMLIDYTYSHNITTLKADVSITGLPLFIRNGFEIVPKENNKEYRNRQLLHG